MSYLRNTPHHSPPLWAVDSGNARARGEVPENLEHATNPLIGNWVVAPGEETCSIVSRSFTATTETTTVRPIGPYPGETGTGPVRYNLEDPKNVYVIGPTGITNAGRWQVVDANHIRDSSFSDCLYQRAK